MKRFYTLCFAGFALCPGVFACSWVPYSFCETSNLRPDDVVISGKVVSVDMDGIDLEVIDVLTGSESRDTIRIWDGTDWDCNGLFSMAASDLGGLNDSIIVILPLITAIENSWDVLGDYRRPDYFGYTPELAITNGMVIGYIWGPAMTPIWEMPYEPLVANWSDGPDACSGFLSIEGSRQTAPFAAHLANNTLILTIPSDAKLGSTVRIYAASGQEIVAVKGIAGTMLIDLTGLSMDVYHIVLVQQDGLRSSTRVMKLQ